MELVRTQLPTVFAVLNCHYHLIMAMVLTKYHCVARSATDSRRDRRATPRLSSTQAGAAVAPPRPARTFDKMWATSFERDWNRALLLFMAGIPCCFAMLGLIAAIKFPNRRGGADCEL